MTKWMTTFYSSSTPRSSIVKIATRVSRSYPSSRMISFYSSTLNRGPSSWTIQECAPRHTGISTIQEHWVHFNATPNRTMFKEWNCSKYAKNTIHIIIGYDHREIGKVWSNIILGQERIPTHSRSDHWRLNHWTYHFGEWFVQGSRLQAEVARDWFLVGAPKGRTRQLPV